VFRLGLRSWPLVFTPKFGCFFVCAGFHFSGPCEDGGGLYLCTSSAGLYTVCPIRFSFPASRKNIRFGIIPTHPFFQFLSPPPSPFFLLLASVLSPRGVPPPWFPSSVLCFLMTEFFTFPTDSSSVGELPSFLILLFRLLE